MNVGKFIDVVNGVHKQILAVLHSSGASDADKIIRLDSTGRLSLTVLPVGVVPDTQSVVTSETLAANDLVQIFDDVGSPKCRKADATAINHFNCVGFVKDNFNLGETALIYFEGRVTGLSGLVAGTRMFLSTTPGQASSTPVSGFEELSQKIGTAVDATTISFERAEGVTLSAEEI